MIEHEIIDKHCKEMEEEVAQRYINIVERLTKGNFVAWKEYYSADIEQYVMSYEECSILAYLCYNAMTEQLTFYIEDTELDKSYVYDDKKWDKQILDIYAYMTTVSENDSYSCWDKDTEIIESDDFVEDYNYNFQILGKYKDCFQLNVNYNIETLG